MDETKQTAETGSEEGGDQRQQQKAAPHQGEAQGEASSDILARVAAARAIVGRPALVLADEPTGALDSKAAGQLLRQLSALNQTGGATILMVTHDAFTASWCRRILFIKDGGLYRELLRGEQDRRSFFSRILEVVSTLGGDGADVL